MKKKHLKKSSTKSVPKSSASFEPIELNGEELTNQEMKAILDSSPTGIGIIKNRIIQWSNDLLYSMFGYESGTLKGKNIRVLFVDRNEYDRAGAILYSGMEKYGNGIVETKMLRKDKSQFDCRIRASMLDIEDPSKGSLIVVTDISEIKLLQIQLQQAQKMEAIGVLAGGISHDFNNILMGIQGHLSLMQIDMTAVHQVETHVKHIGRLVGTAAELTGRLLGFARGGKYQISVLDANELLKITLEIFKPTRKGIIIHETFEEKIHQIEADQTQLEQVFLNLLINASQAMADPGDIYIRTKNIIIKKDHDYPFEIKPGEYIRISIKDTGIGMDTEIQKRIFDPFFSTKEIGDHKGRGLGLSTVFGIIKNHGGFILVESEKGKGSTFHINLPACSIIETKEAREKSLPHEQIQKGTETVLFVDDEQDIVNVGKHFLEKLGYKPLIAMNGLEAVEMFRSHKDEISLVVLDLVMPKMNGRQAFLEIKEIREDVKILICTGASVDDEIEGFLNQGNHGFIQKPFSLEEFSGSLRKILDKT